MDSVDVDEGLSLLDEDLSDSLELSSRAESQLDSSSVSNVDESGDESENKYLSTPNLSPIGQLVAEIWHFGPNLDHIFGPSSGTLEPI